MGYIVVGVAEEQGQAKRPVKGLETEQIARIQREMIGFNNLIRLVYHPRLFIDEVDRQQILVIWVPGNANRPHEVPEQITANQKTYFYYVRQYANSIKVDRGEQKHELIAMTNQVPFDDRPNTQATLNDISISGFGSICAYHGRGVRRQMKVDKRRENGKSQHCAQLKAYYQRKVAEGKHKMLVLNNVRNKLVLRVFACVRDDRNYDEKYMPALV